MMGGFVLGQVSALSPDYEKAKVAAARLFKIFDRKSAIDSSSEDGLRPVRIFSICVNYTDFCEATAEENESLFLITSTPFVQPCWTGLNNICACARFHGSRWRRRPGHHTKPRKNGGVFKKFRIVLDLW